MRVLTISDLHCPYHHPGAIDWLARIKRKVRPDRVICLGDEIDAHGWSRYPTEPDALGPSAELTAAKAAIQRLGKLFPRVDICTSNHAARALKRLSEAGVPSEFMRPLPDVLGAPPGWTWADRVTCDHVHYCHGEGVSGQNGALTMAIRLRRSVVIGHLHAWAGVQYHNNGLDQIWAANAGCLVDPTAPVFRYGRWSLNKPVLGTCLVIDRVPRFVPFGEDP